MLSWKFYISNIEVEEPQGWDGVEFTLKRSDTYIGLDDVYTEDSLVFDSIGARLIREEFAKNGFEGQLSLRIEEYCHGKPDGTLHWSLNLATFSQVNNEVTIRAEDTRFQRKFGSRMNSVVSLSSTESIGGVPLPALPLKTISLHSKEIFITGKASVSEPYTSRIETILQAVVVPIFNTIASDEGLQLELPTIELLLAGDVATPLFTSLSTQLYKTRIKLKGSFDYSVLPIGNVQLVKSVNSNGTATVIYDGRWDFFDIDYYEEVVYPKGTTVQYAFIVLSNSLALFLDFKLTIQEGFFEISASSIEPASTAKGYYLYDVFNRVTELITDTPFSFRSNFFGISGRVPIYELDGCGAMTFLTNGKNIRNMLQKDGTNYAISMSFMELYNACNAIWNLGMQIEYDTYGRGVVRVENKEYFYKNQPSLSLTNVADLKTRSAFDKVYNGLEIGYSKWNLDKAQVNSIDELNTIHYYTLPLENAKKKITAASDFITSGYVIEQTRRVQFNTAPTTSYDTDDDKFLISLNRQTVNSIYHSTIAKDFKKGEVSERDENFEGVDNLISPQTAYNLRLSPTRNALRWYRFLASSLYYKIKESPNVAIKFQNGEGNILERDTMINDCDDASGEVRQNMDILPGDVFNPDPLYKPEYYEFEYPLTMSQFNTILANADKTISVSCDGVNFVTGFVESVNYKPNSDEGLASIQLLAAPDGEGAFDEGFDEGFDI